MGEKMETLYLFVGKCKRTELTRRFRSSSAFFCMDSLCKHALSFVKHSCFSAANSSRRALTRSSCNINTSTEGLPTSCSHFKKSFHEQTEPNPTSASHASRSSSTRSLICCRSRCRSSAALRWASPQMLFFRLHFIYINPHQQH